MCSHDDGSGLGGVDPMVEWPDLADVLSRRRSSSRGADLVLVRAVAAYDWAR